MSFPLPGPSHVPGDMIGDGRGSWNEADAARRDPQPRALTEGAHLQAEHVTAIRFERRRRIVAALDQRGKLC